MIGDLTNFKGQIKWGTNARPYEPPMLMTHAEKLKFETGRRPKYAIAEGQSLTVKYWKAKLLRLKS